MILSFGYNKIIVKPAHSSFFFYCLMSNQIIVLSLYLEEGCSYLKITDLNTPLRVSVTEDYSEVSLSKGEYLIYLSLNQFTIHFCIIWNIKNVKTGSHKLTFFIDHRLNNYCSIAPPALRIIAWHAVQT
jgi:hypothetical protein